MFFGGKNRSVLSYHSISSQCIWLLLSLTVDLCRHGLCSCWLPQPSVLCSYLLWGQTTSPALSWLALFTLIHSVSLETVSLSLFFFTKGNAQHIQFWISLWKTPWHKGTSISIMESLCSEFLGLSFNIIVYTPLPAFTSLSQAQLCHIAGD